MKEHEYRELDLRGMACPQPVVETRRALLEIRQEGLKTHLAALVADVDHGLYGGESVFSGDLLVGRIRSAAYGYSVGRSIGLIYLPPDLAVADTPLSVEIFGDRVPARVATLPLVDPAGEEPKS